MVHCWLAAAGREDRWAICSQELALRQEAWQADEQSGFPACPQALDSGRTPRAWRRHKGILMRYIKVAQEAGSPAAEVLWHLQVGGYDSRIWFWNAWLLSLSGPGSSQQGPGWASTHLGTPPSPSRILLCPSGLFMPPST